MKGNIDLELNPEIKKQIERKYEIEKIDKFKLPKENSERSLVVIRNK